MPGRTPHERVRRVARILPYRLPPLWQGQLIAIVCVAAGAAVRFLLDPVVENHIPVAVFYPFVIVASAWGGTLSGLTTMLLAAVIADYFWVPPGGSFKLTVSAIIPLSAFTWFCGFAILMLSLFRALLEDRVESEQRAVLLSHEMKHRASNLLGMAEAISAQTAQSASSVGDHHTLFVSRLNALAQAQQLTIEEDAARPDLRQFLQQLLKPFGADRFVLDGPTVAVPGSLATSFALLFHELATNATKHGALSVPEGVVFINWQNHAERVRLQWQERHGPPVMAPTRTGFGSRLIRTAFPPEHGEAVVSFDPHGVNCAISFAAS
jgi:two-component sensor histidine kinase